MTLNVRGYTVDGLIGRGSSGQVWRARISRTDQPVALKVVSVAGSAPAQAARVEAAVLMALDHPHLIRLHEVIEVPAAVVLVLDYADAGSLADLLTRRGRLTAGEVVTALAPIGAALAYAHGQGIVHGDVSAANILFTAIGLPLLADLGVARIAGDDGPVQGTPAYIDPIVARGQLAGTSSDVFGLAAVAVHALSGQPLWPGSTAAEMVAAAAADAFGEVVDLDSLLPDTPESVRAVLARALIFEPARRCTAAEFALDLRHAVAPTPVELRAGREPGRTVDQNVQLTYGVRLPAIDPSTFPRRRRSRLPTRRRRLVSVVAVVAVAAIAVVAALAIGLRPRGQAVAGGPPAVADAQSALATLAGLDALRQRAFAERDPALFAQVYSSGVLQNQDSALLQQLVPAGCALIGLHTDYRDARLVPGFGGAPTVVVTAVLAPSVLKCAGQPAVTEDGISATTLRIDLTRASDGHYLIAALRAV